jgi:16S rRNA (adenine1518-N6/adenine1519-N6)-dimethyltransferase
MRKKSENKYMKAKKSLGQHFLTSQKALRQMVAAGDVQEGDTVLEIGPGKGALTRYLLETGADVVAIETDADMIDILKKEFGKEIRLGRLALVHGDIRNAEKILKMLKKYKLVANIPYYITGEIIRDFLSRKNQPQSMTLLVQREVATRIARDPKESILSIAVKVYGDPRYVDTVPAGAFSPPPKVDSAIITIHNISKKRLGDTNEEHFFNVLKTGFAARRKMLRGNLAKKWPSKAVESALTEAEIPPDARGEDVHLEKWAVLAQILNPNH